MCVHAYEYKRAHKHTHTHTHTYYESIYKYIIVIGIPRCHTRIHTCMVQLQHIGTHMQPHLYLYTTTFTHITHVHTHHTHTQAHTQAHTHTHKSTIILTLERGLQDADQVCIAQLSGTHMQPHCDTHLYSYTTTGRRPSSHRSAICLY